MAFSIHYENNSNLKVSVTEEIWSRDEAKKLAEFLEDNAKLNIHLTFIDAGMVSVELAEALFRLQSQGSCRIYVKKRHLYSYFYRIGIECSLVPREFREKPLGVVYQPAGNSTLHYEEVLSFLEKIREKYGYDYTNYQMDSIMRRIKISMLRENQANLGAFASLAMNDYEIFEQLFLDFSINTTEFFRDPEVYRTVKDRVLPLLDSFHHIKIWCAGCSNGKEPYSLAILLKEAGLLERTQIYATDINPYVIEEGRNGLYPLEKLEAEMENYREAGGLGTFQDYFELKGNYVKVNPEIQKNILFFQHSLVGSGIINEFQMILCRNVIIYFNQDLQREVMEYFNNSLEGSGFLVLGKSESILNNGGNSFYDKFDEAKRIYRKNRR